MPEDYELIPKCAAADYKKFLESPVWADMKMMLSDLRDKMIKGILSTDNIHEVNRLQGGIRQVNILIDFPEAQLEALEIEEKEISNATTKD